MRLLRVVLSVLLAGLTPPVLCRADAPVIGIATVNGSITVDDSLVRGTASIMDGSLVETGRTSSQLSLKNGIRIELNPDSRGKVYRDRLALERGTGQLRGQQKFQLLANSLSVIPGSVDSLVRVRIKNPTTIQVAAITGDTKVFNGHGQLLADIAAGRALEFNEEPSAAGQGAASATQVSGCLKYKDGKYFLNDDTTHVVSQLVGDFSKYKSKRIQVTGSIDSHATPPQGASQVVNPDASGPVEKGKCSDGLAMWEAMAIVAAVDIVAIAVTLAGSEGTPVSQSP